MFLLILTQRHFFVSFREKGRKRDRRRQRGREREKEREREGERERRRERERDINEREISMGCLLYVR